MASSLIIKIDGDTKSLEQSLNNAGSVAKKSMAIATTAVVALGTAATMVGKEFESSMAMVSTLFGDVNVDVDNLNNSVLALSSSSGYAAKELADSLYNALSAGVVVTEDMSEAMDFMEQSTKLAIGAGAELGDVVDAQTSILNAYKLGVEETDTVQKILMQTQNKGKTTVAELSASIANVIPTAAALGVEFDQVGAALATMTAQGTDTSKATTQLNTLLAELGKEGTVASSILYDLTGSSFQELTAQGKDLSDVLNLLTVNLSKDSQAISQMMNVVNTATGENYTFEESLAQLGLSASDVEGELLNMFGSVEAGKAALSLAGSNSETFKENLEAMGTSADVVGDAYDTMTDTVDHQLSRLVENVKNAGIKLYDNFKEPLEEIIKEMADFVASFDVDAALESLQELYNKFSWLLPIIAGVVSAFVALTAVMKISSFIKSISTAFTLLNTVMAANPILLVVMAIAALVAALVTAYATSETFRNTVNAVFESVKSFIISAIDTIKNTIATIGEWFTNV
ncbi:MAG: phage tail tape measure protein, partial [Clostridia bacterium]